VENAMLMVPPQAVWIPADAARNRATPGAQLCFLFIEPRHLPMLYLKISRGRADFSRGKIT
jgi:hypothetical protein